MSDDPKQPEKLDSAHSIHDALLNAAERPREVTRHEANEDLDGWDRHDWFKAGYSAALREFAARIREAWSPPSGAPTADDWRELWEAYCEVAFAGRHSAEAQRARYQAALEKCGARAVDS